jgi:hypothetical protein
MTLFMLKNLKTLQNDQTFAKSIKQSTQQGGKRRNKNKRPKSKPKEQN